MVIDSLGRRARPSRPHSRHYHAIFEVPTAKTTGRLAYNVRLVANPSNEALLSIRGLRCGVNGRTLFERVDLTLAAGELVEVRGPNGSGKTTLLRCVAGLFTEDAGQVRVRPPERPLYLGHRPGVNPMLSTLENIRWYLALEGRPFSARACRDAADAVGLGRSAARPCAALSAGQRRRAGLARLVVSRARLWLLDEPFAALDDAGRDLARGLIGRHREAGGAVLCATHEAVPLPDAGRLELPG